LAKFTGAASDQVFQLLARAALLQARLALLLELVDGRDAQDVADPDEAQALVSRMTSSA